MKWLSKLKKYAPDIASAIASGGATLPSLAIKAVADAVGDSAIVEEADLAEYIEQADPETMLKIKQANNSFKIRMRELDNELLDSELRDKQNARDIHRHSRMPAAICILLTIMVASGAYMLFTLNIPAANKEIAYLLFGSLLTKWGDSIAYWVGTTRSSSQKTIMMGQK